TLFLILKPHFGPCQNESATASTSERSEDKRSPAHAMRQTNDTGPHDSSDFTRGRLNSGVLAGIALGSIVGMLSLSSKRELVIDKDSRMTSRPKPPPRSSSPFGNRPNTWGRSPKSYSISSLDENSDEETPTCSSIRPTRRDQLTNYGLCQGSTGVDLYTYQDSHPFPTPLDSRNDVRYSSLKCERSPSVTLRASDMRNNAYDSHFQGSSPRVAPRTNDRLSEQDPSFTAPPDPRHLPTRDHHPSRPGSMPCSVQREPCDHRWCGFSNIPQQHYQTQPNNSVSGDTDSPLSRPQHNIRSSSDLTQWSYTFDHDTANSSQAAYKHRLCADSSVPLSPSYRPEPGQQTTSADRKEPISHTIGSADQRTTSTLIADGAQRFADRCPEAEDVAGTNSDCAESSDRARRHSLHECDTPQSPGYFEDMPRSRSRVGLRRSKSRGSDSRRLEASFVFEGNPAFDGGHPSNTDLIPSSTHLWQATPPPNPFPSPPQSPSSPNGIPSSVTSRSHSRICPPISSSPPALSTFTSAENSRFAADFTATFVGRREGRRVSLRISGRGGNE
ncbi:uncharacterized protein BDR25DRAFT_367600, partial [Lindgomyces ingoldianus]